MIDRRANLDSCCSRVPRRHSAPSDGGKIVLVSSTGGNGQPSTPTTRPPKRVISFTKSLAVELARAGSRELCCAGWVDTEMSATPYRGSPDGKGHRRTIRSVGVRARDCADRSVSLLRTWPGTLRRDSERERERALRMIVASASTSWKSGRCVSLLAAQQTFRSACSHRRSAADCAGGGQGRGARCAVRRQGSVLQALDGMSQGCLLQVEVQRDGGAPRLALSGRGGAGAARG